MKDLNDYIFLEEDRDRIEFDDYGRPYIKEEIGRMMLSRRTKYNYTINNQKQNGNTNNNMCHERQCNRQDKNNCNIYIIGLYLYTTNGILKTKYNYTIKN